MSRPAPPAGPGAENREARDKRLRLRRRALEIGHLEAWLSRGRGWFHFENIRVLGKLVQWGLMAVGLYRRGLRNALSPEWDEISFSFPDLPAAFDGYRILHLSDLHLDGAAGLAEAAVRLLDGAACDVCLLTGDYRFAVSGPSHAVERPLRLVLEALHPPDGFLGILGNHDFAEVEDILVRLGVTVLRNRSVPLRRGSEAIWIAGVDDHHYYGCDDLPGALEDVPPDGFTVLLAHSPELYREAGAAGVKAYLCGHTHAGQLCLPGGVPVLVNANCPRRLVRGPWNWNGVLGYTHPGLGSSVRPIRYHCPPRVARITLHRGDGPRAERAGRDSRVPPGEGPGTDIT